MSDPAPLPFTLDEPQALDPAHIQASRLGGSVGALVLSGFLLPGLLLVALEALGLAGCLLTWTLGTVLLVLRALLWPAVAYRYQCYLVTLAHVEIRRGVIWRSVVAIPRSRLQHIDVNQGPFERAFGLGHLVLHTAGTASASISLEGLRHTTALALRDHLLPRGAGEDV